MSDLGIGRAPPGGDGNFRVATVAILVVIGVLGFIGTLVLGAYAPDFRSGHNGGAHALSNAAVGYSGIVRLAEATGRHPRVLRDAHALDGENLLVATPEHGFVDVSPVLTARSGRPTLFVLPKWDTGPDRDHPGWVRRAGVLDRADPAGVLAPGTKLKIARRHSRGWRLVVSPDLPRDIRLAAPRALQVITGVDRTPYEVGRQMQTPGTVEPLITDGHGGAVLVKLADQPVYVLSDPDLMANWGLRSATQAASMLALLDWLNANHATGIDFDVTLNGFGHSRSPLRLAFEPPFLAMTLAIAAALLLAGLHATGTFGARRPRVRALAFGKRALVDNAALLVAKAGRQARLGARYTQVVRERARVAFGVPARLKGEAIDAYLDRLPGRARFTTLAAAAADADDNRAVLAAAQALNAWRIPMTGENGW